jgi:hypothetical protein
MFGLKNTFFYSVPMAQTQVTPNPGERRISPLNSYFDDVPVVCDNGGLQRVHFCETCQVELKCISWKCKNVQEYQILYKKVCFAIYLRDVGETDYYDISAIHKRGARRIESVRARKNQYYLSQLSSYAGFKRIKDTVQVTGTEM